jgi:hypothetical protein
VKTYPCQFCEALSVLVNNRIHSWSWPFREKRANICLFWTNQRLKLLAVINVRQFCNFLHKVIKISSSALNHVGLVLFKKILSWNWRNETTGPSWNQCTPHLIELLESPCYSELTIGVTSYNTVHSILWEHAPPCLSFYYWYFYFFLWL